jgi:hypothetical protein
MIAHPHIIHPKIVAFPFILHLSPLFRQLVKERCFDIELLWRSNTAFSKNGKIDNTFIKSWINDE